MQPVQCIAVLLPQAHAHQQLSSPAHAASIHFFMFSCSLRSLALPLAQVPDRAHSDQLVLRRLALARGDPLKAINAKEAVRAAANKVRCWHTGFL
jgi:hypothetical protein